MKWRGMLCVFGLLLLVSGALHFFPMQHIAGLFSSDGLTDEARRQLAASQWTLSGAVLAAALLLPLLLALQARVTRAFAHASDRQLALLWGLIAFAGAGAV